MSLLPDDSHESVASLHCNEYVGSTIVTTKEPFQKDLLGALMDLTVPGSTVVDAGVLASRSPLMHLHKQLAAQ